MTRKNLVILLVLMSLLGMVAVLVISDYLSQQNAKFEVFADIKLKMTSEDVVGIAGAPSKKEFVDLIDVNGVNHGVTRYTWFSRVNNFSVEFDSNGLVSSKHYWSEPGSTFLDYLRRRYERSP